MAVGAEWKSADVVAVAVAVDSFVVAVVQTAGAVRSAGIADSFAVEGSWVVEDSWAAAGSRVVASSWVVVGSASAEVCSFAVAVGRVAVVGS